MLSINNNTINPAIMTGYAKVNGADVKFRSSDSCEDCKGSFLDLAVRSPICGTCVSRKVFRKCWSPKCNVIFCATALDTISSDGLACCEAHAPPASRTVPVSIAFYRHNKAVPEVTGVLADVPIWSLFSGTVVRYFLAQQLLGDYLQLNSPLGAWKFEFAESVCNMGCFKAGVEKGTTVRSFLEFLKGSIYEPSTMMGTLTKTTGFPFAELTLDALLDPTSTLASVYNADLLRLEATIPRNTAGEQHIMPEGLLMNTCLPPDYGGFAAATGAFSFNLIHYSEMEERKDRRDQKKAAAVSAPAPPPPASKPTAVKARKSASIDLVNSDDEDEEETKPSKSRKSKGKGKGTKRKAEENDDDDDEDEGSFVGDDCDEDEEEEDSKIKKPIMRRNVNRINNPNGDGNNNDAEVNAWFQHMGGKKPAPGAKQPIDARSEEHPFRVIFQVPGADKFYWRLTKDFATFCSPRRKNGGHHQFYVAVDFCDAESMTAAVGMMHQINYFYSNHPRSAVVMELISAILQQEPFDFADHEHLVPTAEYMVRNKLNLKKLFKADKRPKFTKRGKQGKDTTKHGLVSGPLNAPSAPKKSKVVVEKEKEEEEEEDASSSASSSSVPQPPALPTPDFGASFQSRHNTHEYVPQSPGDFMMPEVEYDGDELF